MENVDPRVKYGWDPANSLGAVLYANKRKQLEPEPSGLAYGLALEWEEAAARNKKQKLGRASKPHSRRPPQPPPSTKAIVIEDEDDDELSRYEAPRTTKPIAPSTARRKSPPLSKPPPPTVCTCNDPANAAYGNVQCSSGPLCAVGTYYGGIFNGGIADTKVFELRWCSEEITALALTSNIAISLDHCLRAISTTSSQDQTHAANDSAHPLPQGVPLFEPNSRSARQSVLAATISPS